MKKRAPLPVYANQNSRLLSAKQAAEFLGLSTAYLAKLRSDGGGPIFIKIGAAVRYTPDDLATFIAAHRHTSTDY